MKHLSHVLVTSLFWQNHCFTFPGREKGNKQSLMVSAATPHMVTILQSSRKFLRWALTPSFVLPQNGRLHRVDQGGFKLKIHIPNINIGSSRHISGGEDGKVAKGLLSHEFGCRCQCLKSQFACRQQDLGRDDARSDPSHELLGIFNEVCWQGKISHTLHYFHPIKRKQKATLAFMSSSYLLFTLPSLCISKTFTPMPSSAMVPEILVDISQCNHQERFKSIATAPGNASAICLNVYRKDPQAHGYIIVKFHPEVFRVSLFIFSQGMAQCVKVFTRYTIMAV